MQTQSTFVGWDFDSTWTMVAGSYPMLQFYARSLTNAVITTASLKGFQYDGTAKTPQVTSVTLFGTTLSQEMDFTVSYLNNTNAGTATIEVCGVGTYSGCQTIPFEIQALKITPTIAEIASVTYDGKEQTPKISVYNGKTLIADSEYSVKYENNVNPGTATVTVTMRGNYLGTASATFIIEESSADITSAPEASEIPHRVNLSLSGKTLSIFGAATGTPYQLFDLQGKLLEKGRINSAETRLTLPHSGNYILRVGKKTSQIRAR